MAAESAAAAAGAAAVNIFNFLKCGLEGNLESKETEIKKLLGNGGRCFDAERGNPHAKSAVSSLLKVSVLKLDLICSQWNG